MKKLIVILTFCAGLILSCSKDDLINNTSGTGNPVSNNRQPTGSSSNDLLSDKKFKSMVVEIVYVEGFEPTANAISNFVSFLDSRINKPNGITIVKRAIPSTGKSPYTNQEIIAIEDANRTKYNTLNQIAVWAFFADGKSDSDSSSGVTLGTAYRNTSFVIYEQTMQGLSDSPFEPSRSLLETTVISHEFGHILGLTNLGSAMQSSHEDTAHAKHCNIESCLMYWSSETGNGIANLASGGITPKLDSQGIADLQANGGK